MWSMVWGARSRLRRMGKGEGRINMSVVLAVVFGMCSALGLLAAAVSSGLEMPGEGMRIKWPIPAKKNSVSKMQDELDNFHKAQFPELLGPSNLRFLQATPPSDLMTSVNKHLAEKEEKEAYAELVVLFHQFHSPELLSNAAVLLEQMNHFDAALLWYEIGRKLFPANDPAFISNMKNTIQHYGRSLFQRGEREQAKRAFKQLFSLAPDFTTARYNYAVLLENMGDIPSAVEQLQALLSAAETKEDRLMAASSLCRASLSMCQTKGAALMAESFSTRQKYFGIAKEACGIAHQLDSEDPANAYHLGLLYREGAAYDISIHYFTEAHKRDPENIEYEHQLAGTLARIADFEGTERHMLNVIEHAVGHNKASSQFALGIMISPMSPNHQLAKELMLDAVVRAPEDKAPPSLVGLAPCPSGKDEWTVAVGAGAAKNAASIHTLFPSTGVVETAIHGNAPFALRFPDKPMYHIIFTPAVVEGSSAVIVSSCEVVAFLDLNTNLPAEFVPTRRSLTRVPGKTLYMLHSKMSNYYHLVAEVLTRLTVAVHAGVLKEVDRVVTLDSQRAPLLHEYAQLLAEFTSYDVKPWKGSHLLEYDVGKRYEFANLHVVSWSHPDGVLGEDVDLWDSFLPSKSAALMLNSVTRDIVRRVREEDRSPISPDLRRRRNRPKVIYCSRTGIRSVEHENLLIEELEEYSGIFDLHVFSSPPDTLLMPRTSVRSRMLYQMDLFHDADLIIGPHGAGLSNMMFAPRGGVVMEFVMDPHGNRCFGYLAAALGHEYHAINEVTSTYFGSYTMTAEAAHSIASRVATALSSTNSNQAVDEQSRDEL